MYEVIDRLHKSYRLRKAIRASVIAFRMLFSHPEKALYGNKLIKSQHLSLPDFLIIGAPKCATWWLAENLEQHPEIFIARGESRGEIHYFDEQFYKSIQYYSLYFQPGLGKVKGEKTPSYCNLPESRIKFIHKLLPDLKLILLLRSPSERTWSHVMMNLVRKPGVDFASLEDDVLIRHLEETSKIYNYVSILDRWESVFPKKNIYVGFHDEIQESPKKFLKDVWEFLGVSTDVNWETIPFSVEINKGPGVIMSNRYRDILKKLHEHQIAEMHRRFNVKTDHWW